MPWIETESLSFIARHEAEDTDYAQRTLDALEDLRLRLEERFDEVPGGITVIIHPTPGWLDAAHPFLPLARLAAAPAGRRYLAGWAMATELHVLNGTYLDRRAAGQDSLAALRGTPERLYVQVVLGANNKRLPPPWGPRRFLRYLQWTWLIDGAAQYYANQVLLFRAAVSTRLRERRQPAFPPGARDAMILGGTVFDLLERERGPDACDVLASRLRRDGPRKAVELAFGGRFRDVEREWREYLRKLTTRRLGLADEVPALELGDELSPGSPL
jgi:hypothetical protein